MIETIAFSNENLYKVLVEISAQCEINGREIVLLEVQDLYPEEISIYCGLLDQLGFVRIVTYVGMDYDFNYPVKITLHGKKFLETNDANFYTKAEKAGRDIIQKFTGVDITPFVYTFNDNVEKEQKKNLLSKKNI